MKKVPIHTAKTQLSRLIKEACAGEDIVIANGDRPVVRLVPVDAAKPARVFGALRGKVWVDDRFFEPLPSDELSAWEP